MYQSKLGVLSITQSLQVGPSDQVTYSQLPQLFPPPMVVLIVSQMGCGEQEDEGCLISSWYCPDL